MSDHVNENPSASASGSASDNVSAQAASVANASETASGQATAAQATAAQATGTHGMSGEACGSSCGSGLVSLQGTPTAGSVICEDRVREALKAVIDPELFVNIVDLGLVYTVNLDANAEEAAKTDVAIEMTLTSPMCPAGPQLVANSRQVIEAIDGVAKVDVKVVMDPPWTPDCMTEDARDQLGIF
jgi:metal-sulfur cluster biosynthetic enzyme